MAPQVFAPGRSFSEVPSGLKAQIDYRFGLNDSDVAAHPVPATTAAGIRFTTGRAPASGSPWFPRVRTSSRESRRPARAAFVCAARSA
jgi:hypothetical protein